MGATTGRASAKRASAMTNAASFLRTRPARDVSARAIRYSAVTALIALKSRALSPATASTAFASSQDRMRSWMARCAFFAARARPLNTEVCDAIDSGRFGAGEERAGRDGRRQRARARDARLDSRRAGRAAEEGKSARRPRRRFARALARERTNSRPRRDARGDGDGDDAPRLRGCLSPRPRSRSRRRGR